MEELRRRLLERWKTLDWDGWWGDWIDVRFELAARLGGFRGQWVLDVGCGPGVILAELDESNQRVGVDLSLTRLKQAKRICPQSLLVQADVEHLPFRAGQFDAMILGGVIEYVKDREGFAQELFRVGRPQAQILGTTHNREYWPYWNHALLLEVETLKRTLSIFPKAAIYGFNPLPTLASLLPKRARKRLPVRWYRFLAIPSPVLARIPGIGRFLRFLMRWEFLCRRSKAFLFWAEK